MSDTKDKRPFGISTAKRVFLQTNEEWLLEYETGRPVRPAALDDLNAPGFMDWYNRQFGKGRP
jgi:hypothetical protein